MKAAAIAVALAAALAAACTRAPHQNLPAGALRGSNVLLITIDTLRADRLGAYGSQRGLTPTLDRLAAEGLRFSETYAHVPLTLPSHAALLTARYPVHNGVRDNGTYRLDPSQPTIATTLKAAGYRTGAFVGAFVLDARFGLNRGFDVYDDRMLGTSADLEVVQRPAEAVLAAAYDWITARPKTMGDGRSMKDAREAAVQPTAGQPQTDVERPAPDAEHAPLSTQPAHPAPGTQPRHSAPSTPPQHPAPGTQHAHPAPSTGTPHEAPSTSAPFFVWIHLYDPHEPYTPPEPYRSRYSAEPYDGEIAYVDASLGAFLDRVRAAGSLSNTLIIVASDHGESLGEHGERTHGLFAYNSTLRVPLVMWSGGRIQPAVYDSPARLVDVVPTVLDLVGAAPLADVDGRSVRAIAAGEQKFDDRGSYFEALNANLTRGWAPLTGIVYGGAKLVDLPVPELYDEANDPSEQHNRYVQERDRDRDLEARLDRVSKTRASAAQPAGVDADAEARLRSLGYIVASGPRPDRKYTSADDPKTLVHLNAMLDEAADQWSRGDGAAATALLRKVIAERPDLTIAYDRLAFMLSASGRPTEAVAVLDRAARDGHADRPLLRSLGNALRDAGELTRSASVLENVARQDPSDLQTADALGQSYARLGRFADAEAQFRRVLAASPNAAATWSNLGALYLGSHRVEDAVTALERAVALNPNLPAAHNALGVAYAQRDQIDRAVAEWQRAVALRPGYQDAIANLERVRR